MIESAVFHVIVSLVSALFPAAQTAPAAVPRFEPGACPFTAQANERVDCGMLIVREDRAKPSGPTVQIPVRIFRGRSATPAPDPVLFMLGGPGGSALTTSVRNLPAAETRDYIVFDERGTRNTRPSLDCPEMVPVKQDVARGNLRAEAAEPEMVKAATQCAARLRAQGIDLNAYTSAAIAADIEDLRQVLKIQRWNLYGVSYSVRVMLMLMRDHPDTIRSAILDSVMPLESRFDEVAPANLLRALGIVLDACSVDAVCGKQHPALRANLAAAIDRLSREPVTLTLAGDGGATETFHVNGAVLVNVLGDMLNSPQSARALPAVVDRAAGGDIRALEPLLKESLYFGGYTYGMRLVVWCADFMPFEDRARIAAAHRPEAGAGGAWLEPAPPAVCDALGVSPAPPGDGLAVKSEIPTLLLSGELDPYTPTPWARNMLPNMPKAFLVIVPGASHGPGFTACGGRLIGAFLQDPTRPPADPCVAR